MIVHNASCMCSLHMTTKSTPVPVFKNIIIIVAYPQIKMADVVIIYVLCTHEDQALRR